MHKIFCFGNEFFNGDEVAIELSRRLNIPKYEFIIAESPHDILQADGMLLILDVVKGIPDVCVIDNVDDLEVCNSVTCHDLDLGFYLKLMREAGKISHVKIIGLPFGNKNYDVLEKKVVEILSSLKK